MSLVLGHIFGRDEDIIEVDNDTNIEEVAENVIHEVLESGVGICKSERHNEPFKRTIVSMESGLPFFTISNTNEVVSMSVVDFGKYTGFLQGIKEVGQ